LEEHDAMFKDEEVQVSIPEPTSRHDKNLREFRRSIDCLNEQTNNYLLESMRDFRISLEDCNPTIRPKAGKRERRAR